MTFLFIILLHANLQKLSRPAVERNALLRAAYRLRISQYKREQLVFCDESSCNQKTISRRYGWGAQGKRATKASPFQHGINFTIESALGIDGFLSYEIQKGAYTSTKWNEWIEDCLVCYIEIHVYPFYINLLTPSNT